MDIEKLSREQKEALFKKEARRLLDPEDWDEIDEEYSVSSDWNPKDWTDEKLDRRLKDAIGQVKFNKVWPWVSIIFIILFFIVLKLIF